MSRLNSYRFKGICTFNFCSLNEAIEIKKNVKKRSKIKFYNDKNININYQREKRYTTTYTINYPPV